MTPIQTCEHHTKNFRCVKATIQKKTQRASGIAVRLHGFLRPVADFATTGKLYRAGPATCKPFLSERSRLTLKKVNAIFRQAKIEYILFFIHRLFRQKIFISPVHYCSGLFYVYYSLTQDGLFASKAYRVLIHCGIKKTIAQCITFIAPITLFIHGAIIDKFRPEMTTAFLGVNMQIIQSSDG